MITRATPLLLASQSPRRREILETLQIPFRAESFPVDEDTRPGEDASAYLRRIVERKIERACGAATGVFGGLLVADTTVTSDGRILGKPESDVQAMSMLRALSGRNHQVMTRFALADDGRIIRSEQTVTTEVVFRELEEDEISAYVASGEGRDKAGAYAIQGMGGFLVSRIEGSHSAVVGLPVTELVLALKETGLLPRFPLPAE